MLPTRPRPLERSTSSSCTTPAATTATRVSRGVTLIRISSLTSAALREALEQLRRLVERQPHDARIAAAQLDDEARRAALDRVGAGLVVAFAGRHVLRDVLRAQRLEAHLGARQRALHPIVVLERDGGQHLVRAPGELLEHFRGVLAVHRLLVDVALE